MNIPREQAASAAPKCPQCGKPIASAVTRRIIDRGWNPTTRKQYVRERSMDFCSDRCGLHYQFGCEG